MSARARSVRGHIVKGDSPSHGGAPLAPLAAWESLAIEAVGNVIDFWRFKRNHGRVWALLYLRDHPMSQHDLQELLGLSKGAASMVVRELELWGVVARVRSAGDSTWRYAAETDLSKMIRRVLEERELSFVARTREDLEEAYESARATRDASPAVLARLARMRTLATLVDKALRAFLMTSRLDVASALGVLASSPAERKPDKTHRSRP
jgi:DNA-binding transcriptional regulator GbsR (MarR family)